MHIYIYIYIYIYAQSHIHAPAWYTLVNPPWRQQQLLLQLADLVCIFWQSWVFVKLIGINHGKIRVNNLEHLIYPNIIHRKTDYQMHIFQGCILSPYQGVKSMTLCSLQHSMKIRELHKNSYKCQRNWM